MKLPEHPENYGQIGPNSPFGQALTRAAADCNAIVEIGAWKGLGSTWCLLKGMKPDAHMWSVELNPDCVAMARKFYADEPRVTFLHGTIVTGEEIESTMLPVKGREFEFRCEVAANDTSPYVMNRLPSVFDLLVIDGGDYSAFLEFVMLKDRCRIIALDDVNELKNRNTRRALEAHHSWMLVEENLRDRNGWSIFKRK